MVRFTLKNMISDVRYLMGILVIISCVLIVFTYDVMKDENHDMAYAACLSDVLAAEDGQEELDEIYAEIFENMAVNRYRYTDTAYNELIVQERVEVYWKQVQNYPDYVETIISGYEALLHYTDSSAHARFVASAAINLYGRIDRANVKPAVNIGWEKFFETDILDLGLLIVIVYTCFYLVLMERERGVMALLFASQNGGRRLQLFKQTAGLLLVLLWLVLLRLLKAIILQNTYGLGDWNAQIQSMSAYTDSPYQLTICQYFWIFVLLKTAFVLYFFLFTYLVCALPISEVLAGGIVFALVAAGYAVKGFTAGGWWSILRDSTIYALMDTAYYVKSFRMYTLWNSRNTIIAWTGNVLPVYALCIQSLMALGLTAHLHQCGLKKSRSRRVALQRYLHFRKPIFFNEWTYAGGLCHHGLLMLGLSLLLALGICSFERDYRSDATYMQEYIQKMEEKEPAEAARWIYGRRQELDELEEHLTEISEQLAAGEISEEYYESYVAMAAQQLEVRSVVEELCAQAERNAAIQEQTGIEAQYELTPLTEKIFGEQGRYERIMVNMLMGVFMAFAVMTIFPNERYRGMNRLISAAEYGRSSAFIRVVILLLQIGVLNLALNGIWIVSLAKQYDFTSWNIPMQSWSAFGTDYKLNIGGAVALNMLWSALRWCAAGSIGITISLFMNSTAAAELTGMGLYIVPQVLRLFSLPWLERQWWIRLTDYTGCEVFSALSCIPGALCVAAMLAFALRNGIQDWLSGDTNVFLRRKRGL